jgi:undecaprenyl diphosphate synthase
MGQGEELARQGVRVRIIGERTNFSANVIEMIERIESVTAEGNRLTLVLAFNYSSRREITLATRALAERVARGEMRAEDINEQSIAQALMTAEIPDPDFIIRTSDECRLSNFLLWQASYAEFYFPEVLWPDFGEEAFEKALEVYAERERRYGLVIEE